MNNEPLITKDLLATAGIETSRSDIDDFITHLNDTLEERVGAEITQALSDQKLRELIALQDQGDDDAVGEWIAENVPELPQIAEDERDILIGELVSDADKV